jgi:putative radical SAM enzyme (TIGR03279 family)
MNKGIRITQLDPAGALARAGLKSGCFIRRINGREVEDELDFIFHAAEAELELEWTDRAGKRRRSVIERTYGEELGVEFAPFRPRACRNKCPFCFIFQLPPGLRRTLYFKDEDYRLSFLYGHYITGTSLSEADLERIVEYGLSPLYLSIHATDEALRARMLGRRKLPPLQPLLDYLRDNGIEIHAQIVLCPDWNDGPHLEQTLDDLRAYWPALRSVAVVPVGLTAHREGLPELKPVTAEYARRLIQERRSRQRELKRKLGEQLVFLADEFYLLSGTKLPSYRGRRELPQVENGVGMVWRFMRHWRRVEKNLPDELPRERRVGVVTGQLGGLVLKDVVERLNRIRRLKVELLVVENQLLGNSITVSGLLGGADVARAIQRGPRCDFYLLPANALRPEDQLFLDDVSLDMLQKRVGAPVIALSGDVADLCQAITDPEPPTSAANSGKHYEQPF